MRIFRFILISLVLAAPAFGASGDRPRIGLVLGGGGALGIAHVGVLRELERLHIPIDYIGGTSMGAIVAGLYANGMSPDEIDKAFQSFGQIDSGLNRRYEGTGLGLPLTKKLVDLHHGKIHIESEKGRGTKVTLHFLANPIFVGELTELQETKRKVAV